MSLILPSDHPLRVSLNDEVHARPSEMLRAPVCLSYLAMFSDWNAMPKQWQQVDALARSFGVPGPQPGARHFSADLGAFRLKWERHAEFARYKFIVSGATEDPFGAPAIARIPAEWIAALPGQLIVAAHVALLRAGPPAEEYDALASRLFDGNALVGAAVAGGAADALTDFRIHADRFSRWLLLDRSMTPRQAGRMVQRLLEIDTYRILALMTLPLAQELGPVLARSEQELAQITAALAGARDADEPALLERLTQLEAEIESRQSHNSYRFTAATAYYKLVQRRTQELREQRIHGLQTYQEFIERRLAPAMETCQSTARRQEALSQRVSRVSQLLSTRVDLTRERQNQALLESMDRRARQQLRLQQTVEGLSIAAITYYIVSLVGDAARSLAAAGVGVNPELAMGLSIPLVALLLLAGLQRVRRRLHQAGRSV
jgi:uncharacterized membrane-anchored protein